MKDPSGLSQTGEEVAQPEAEASSERIPQIGDKPFSVGGAMWGWLLSGWSRGGYGSGYGYSGRRNSGDFGGSSGVGSNSGSFVSTSGRITTAPAIRLDEIVVEAPRGPITLGIITDDDIDDIARDYAADGFFPWNLREVLHKSPQHALWDFKRKTDLLPYENYWYNGAERRKDEIGNVIWGRVMANSGWPLSVSLKAAGAYQSISGDSNPDFWEKNWQNLGDDPLDSKSITFGYAGITSIRTTFVNGVHGAISLGLGSPIGASGNFRSTSIFITRFFLP